MLSNIVNATVANASIANDLALAHNSIPNGLIAEYPSDHEALNDVGAPNDSWRDSIKGLGTHIGACISYWVSSDKQFKEGQYVDVATKQIDLLTAESACKMWPIAKGYNNYDYHMCDTMQKWAEERNIAFRGHVLVWASTGWRNAPVFIHNEKNVGKIEAFMKDYIIKLTSRYKGKTLAWDVINEAVVDKGNGLFKDSPFAKVNDWACKSFQWARQGDPHAELFYNDYTIAASNGWSKGKSDKVYNMLKDLKNRNCGVQGVGFQMHINVDFNNKFWNGDHMVDGVRDNIKRYNDIGMKVHITELDIGCHKVGGKCQWNDTWKINQGKLYAQLLQICLEAPNCENFEMWGYTDKHTWLYPDKVLPYDDQYRKKPAYNYLLRTMKGFPRDHPAVVEKVKNRAEREARIAAAMAAEAEEATEGDQNMYLY